MLESVRAVAEGEARHLLQAHTPGTRLTPCQHNRGSRGILQKPRSQRDKNSVRKNLEHRKVRPHGLSPEEKETQTGRRGSGGLPGGRNRVRDGLRASPLEAPRPCRQDPWDDPDWVFPRPPPRPARRPPPPRLETCHLSASRQARATERTKEVSLSHSATNRCSQATPRHRSSW